MGALDAKIVVVTGGSRGLGLAMSQAFAEEGASVVVASRKRDACVAVANELRERTGNDAYGTACHVGHWGDCDRLIGEVMERYGRLVSCKAETCHYSVSVVASRTAPQ